MTSAERRGFQKEAFTHSFLQKKNFILSIFESWEGYYREALIREVSEGGGTARQKIERFFIGALEILEREPGLARMSFGEIEQLMEGLPPERIAKHQENDQKVIERTFAEWAEHGLVDPLALSAIPGIISALFIIVIHKDDFAPGFFEPAVRLIAEALAMRLSTQPKGGES